MNGFAAGRPLCAKGLHFLDVEGATYTLKDGRTRCAACKRSRAARSRAKARRRKEEAERRARLREEQRAAKKAKPPKQPGVTVATAVPPPGGIRSATLVSGEAAARLRLATMVRASRRT